MNNPQKKTADFTLDEKRALVARLLREKSASARGQDGLVHRLFEAQEARTPDAVAVSFEDGRTLTYRALNTKANRLAHRLRSLGVGPERLVGLCVERSPEMVVGLLGILKAGGAYVPLDPGFPEARLALMVEDARVAALVTEQRLRDKLPAVPDGTPVVYLDSDREAIDAEPATNPSPSASAANLAYVIYTSGSTGKPKGVQITHGALRNFLQSMRQVLRMTESDVLLAVTTLSFDIAALELFLPLTVGARLELVSRDVATDGARLAERLDQTGATFLQATPASWRLLLEAGWAGRAGLTMLCGGETLPRELANRLLGQGASLWNLYGPTETTIWSSADRVEPGEGPVSIGRPIANTQMYVLDALLRPVPVGITGELYIGGAGLARGYLGLPALTADRFLPDPFSSTPEARIYRTGDLARWRSDGRLECLGRVDHQVKIRGYRIELGEIESVLARHPGVREVVVVARDEPTGERRLVAYLVPREGADLLAAELRSMLQSALPDYMVPSSCVTLEAMPLTPNGKIDRKALPAPETSQAGSDHTYKPPRGPIEEALTDLWTDLLGRDRVGISDNFFEIGGHSLLATQLFARVRDVFAVETSLRDFFDDPTVAGLSQLVTDAMQAGHGSRVPPLRPVAREGAMPASFAQQRLWFLDQWEPGSPLYNIPIAVRLSGRLDVPALERSLHEIVRRHEVLRTTFAAVDGRAVQVIAPASTLSLPVVDLSRLEESERVAEIEGQVRAAAHEPFDLARGPLIHARLSRLGEREHVLVVTMHHIIADGWSIGVLIHECAAVYQAFSRGQGSPLPELAFQYADFAAWQTGWLQGEILQAELDYWSGQLAGLATLELPTDRPRPAVLSPRGEERTARLPRSLLASLKALSRQEGATLYMTLLAAFQTLLSRYSGQDDIAVGSPIAGRTRSEIENLIGLFVNTLVLRGNLSGSPRFRDLLRQVKRVALDAYAHQDLPFDQLVNVLHSRRDPSRTPLFQVMLVLQNAPLPALESPDLTLTPIPAESGTAKFDLTLFLTETADGLHATAEYRTDLFDAATIDRMLGHFQTLLEGIVANPDQPIATLPMLTEAERQQLLGSWSDEFDPDSFAEDDLADLAPLSAAELDSLMVKFSSEQEATDD